MHIVHATEPLLKGSPDIADSREQLYQIEALSGWAESVPWTHWSTLTFKMAVSRQGAQRIFEQQYVRRLEQKAQRKVLYLAAVAAGRRTGRLHIHALLDVGPKVTATAIQAAWSSGAARVKIYRAGMGAGRYLARHLVDPNTEWLMRFEPRAGAAR